MNTKPWLLLPVIALLLLVGGASAANDQAQLSVQEQKVIDYLVNDWGEDFSVTSVDIAMNAVKVAPSDETRFRIGNYIKVHAELHEVIRRWGWVTLVLTPDEKLIARALINAERDGKPVPSVSDLTIAVAVKEPDVKRGLAMLERYEIVKKDTKIGGVGYEVIPRYVKWQPRLDFVFHKISLDSGRQFNVN
jgi:hypothetical protein